MKFYLLLGLLSPLVLLSAQPDDSCYEDLFSKGMDLLQQRQFSSAVSQFQAAKGCDNLPPDDSLDYMIRLVQQTELKFFKQQTEQLNTLVNRTKELARQEARARAAADIARQQAETNAATARSSEAKAVVNGKRAAALRLGALSELEYNQGHGDVAFSLSLLALRLADEESRSTVMQSFIQALVDSLSIKIPLRDKIDHISTGRNTIDVLSVDNATRFNAKTGSEIAELGSIKQILHADDGQLIIDQGKGRITWWHQDNQATNISVGDFNSEEDRRSMTLEKLPNIARATVLSNQFLVTVNQVNTISLWQNDGKLKTSKKTREGDIYELVLDEKTGSLLARTATGKILQFFRPEANLEYTTLSSDDYVYSCLNSGDVTLAGLSNGKVNIMSPGKTIAYTHGPEPVLEILALSGTDSLLSRALDQDIHLFTVQGKLLKKLAHRSLVLGTRVDRKNRRIFSWTADNEIYVWNYQGELIERINARNRSVSKIMAYGDEGSFLSLDKTGSLTFWSAGYEELYKLAVQTGKLTQAQIDTEARRIVFVNQSATTVHSIPFPEDIIKQYASMSTRELVTQDLINTFNIQFWDNNESR